MMSVKVYSTPSCPKCKQLKKFLSERGVEYEDINVASDPAAAQEMIEKSGQMAVPVIDINGKVIAGFNKKKVVEALGL
jgi:glutaredoxin-like YruB-family protein